MNIDKNQLRVLASCAMARRAEAKQAVAEFEYLFNDIKIRLDRARMNHNAAENNYQEIMKIIAKVEVSK